MRHDGHCIGRRGFLAASGLALAGSLAATAQDGTRRFQSESLRLWSCGGLAEAFMPALAQYESQTGCHVEYTGAFAAALGKSLLGSAQTEVFAPRVLELAKKLREQGKMLAFRPLCFTKYVLVVPKGNPAGVKSIADLARPGLRVVLSPGASPPGGEASLAILKKAGVLDQAQKNAVIQGDCVQRQAAEIATGKGDVAVMELRLTRLPGVVGNVETLDIPEELIPPKPVTFTIGVMKWAHNRELAENFVEFISSDKGQAYFAAAGFIPAASDEGRRLIEKCGVRDE